MATKNVDDVVNGLNVKAPPSLVEFDPPIPIVGEGSKSARHGSTKSAGADKTPSTELDDILHTILPPREIVNQDPDSNDSTRYLQYVSKKPSTRLGVIKCKEKMDELLIERQARQNGICPVREDIYSQAFDELIRQITINGPERGLLLMRVRDEIRMTIDAYKTLYESSVTYGTRKDIQSKEGMPELEEKVRQLEGEKKKLEGRVVDLIYKIEVIEKRAAERRALDQKKQKAEIDFLKYQSEHLKIFLKSFKAKAGIK